jgi:hypothetical protein
MRNFRDNELVRAFSDWHHPTPSCPAEAPGIHALVTQFALGQGVDGRGKLGHDDRWIQRE